MMKKRLLILSDLWGRKKSEWLENYTKELTSNFEIKYYDCCELGNVNTSIYTEENLHQQFINGGIDTAVQKLTELEKNPVTILAFSIGGVIAWKFSLANSKTASLYCISSTRLRYETNKPSGNIYLYFGKNDDYTPKKEWLEAINVDSILVDGDHRIYRDSKFTELVTKQILTKVIKKSLL